MDLPYLKSSAATAELHLVFDDPNRNGPSPKAIESERRYLHRQNDHTSCIAIPVADGVPLPQNWQAFLGNRPQKRLLVNYISMKILDPETTAHLRSHQKIVVAGGFDGKWRDKAFSIKRGQAPTWEPSLSSNHEEGDSRVWLHAFSSGKAQVLIYSPDTDTYHIGLPLLEKYIHTEVTVQLAPSPPATPYSDSRFLLLNRLRQALHHDLDLADIEQSTLTAVFQVVFVTVVTRSGSQAWR